MLRSLAHAALAVLPHLISGTRGGSRWPRWLAPVAERLGLQARLRSLAGAALGQMINTHVPQLLSVAARLGIADLLADGPRTSEELAAAAGAHAPSLHRVLRALASIGIVREDTRGRFHRTYFSDLLRAGVPGSLRPAAIARGERWWWDTIGDLFHAVKTGEIAFERRFGQHFFAYLASHPESAEIFDAYMSWPGQGRHRAVATSYPFASFSTIVDVGGGRGELLAAILAAAPRARGILFDVAGVAEKAASHLAGAGVAERCEIATGDFFSGVPRGGDLYILSQILHDWADERALTILGHCATAMAPNGKVLVIEQILPPPGTASHVAIHDVNMFLLYGARERSEDELRALLERAGLTLTRVLPLAGKPTFRMLEAASRAAGAA